MSGLILDRTGLDDAAQASKAFYSERAGIIEPEWPRIAMESPSTGASTRLNWLANLGKMLEWVGDRNHRRMKAFDYSITNRKWENTVDVMRDEIEDDGLGIVKPRMQNLADSVPLHQDELVFTLLKAGWATACFDGQNFYSAAHPTAAGGTQSNTLGADALDSTGLRLGVATMASFTDWNGNPLNIRPDTLVCGPLMEGAARDLLFADRVASGASNTDKGLVKNLVVSSLITDTQWHLLYTGGAAAALILQMRQGVREREWYSDENDRWSFGVDARYNAGFGLWFYAIASTGA